MGEGQGVVDREEGSTLPSPGNSMWNPWNGGWTADIPGGFHGMVDGFHTFSGWIPYLFQMDFQVDSILFSEIP